MASKRFGFGARFFTAGARDRRYWCRSSYSFALMVYRSALRRTGSIVRALSDGAGVGALDDDMLTAVRLSDDDSEHGPRGCCCAHYNPGKLALWFRDRGGNMGDVPRHTCWLLFTCGSVL
jgi:hypothetical protein